LEEQFGDLDGDGIRRSLVYDYGVGDEFCVPTVVSLQKASDGEWTLDTAAKVSLTLPDQQRTTVEPGQGRIFRF